eukprot:TRINITY_DN10389_c0_g1_i1.p1 TRINITY_DN10389_c0_g1~~TRINITY_DN10389_c0_g1_i1.p1  ORF type:complete len:691 (-),score=212.24 TRINITY_DN10389_c0_g1_i1:148-2220(-)
MNIDDFFGSSQDSTSSHQKPMCQYGSKCYRKNPQHFKDFRHPLDHPDSPAGSIVKKPSKTHKHIPLRQSKTYDDSSDDIEDIESPEISPKKAAQKKSPPKMKLSSSPTTPRSPKTILPTKDYDFKIEVAKRDATCHFGKCNRPIPKGTLRVSKAQQKRPLPYHLACFLTAQLESKKTAKFLSGTDQLEGFSELPKNFRIAVNHAFTSFDRKRKDILKETVARKEALVMPPSNTSNNNPNEKLSALLWKMYEAYKAEGDRFRTASYRKASGAVKNHPVEITSGKQARKIDGIGAKIADKIDEILSTGELNKLDQIRSNPRHQSLEELTKVFGIGSAFAAKLVDEHKINNLVELRLRRDLLSQSQKIGLKYVEEFEKKIPRSEMAEMEIVLLEACKEVGVEGVICGSYRRQVKECGDIDLLITHPSYSTGGIGSPASVSKHAPPFIAKLVDALKKREFIEADLALGNVKYMGVCRLKKEDKKEELLIKDEDILTDEEIIELDEPMKIESKKRTIDDLAEASTVSPEKKKPATSGLKFEIPSLDEISSLEAEQDFELDRQITLERSSSVAALTSSKKKEDTSFDVLPPLNKDVSFIYKHDDDDKKEEEKVSLARRIDILFIPEDCFACALLHFTGSSGFNIEMSKRAINNGMKLSEYCLSKSEEGSAPFIIRSEKDIFDNLGIDYLPPEKRSY